MKRSMRVPKAVNRVASVVGVLSLAALVWAANLTSMGYQNPKFDTTVNQYDYWITDPAVNSGVIDIGCGVQYSWAASVNNVTDEVQANFINGIRLGPATQTGSFEVAVYQTRMYFNGQLVEVPSPSLASPKARLVAAVNVSYGSTDPWLFYPMQQFYKEALVKDQTYKTGEYIVRIFPKSGCGSTQIMYFNVFKFNSDGYPTTPPGSGPPSEGANGTEEEQRGFWEGLFHDLFVPDQECVDGVKEKAEQLANWGPIGLFNQVVASMEDPETQAQFGTTMELPIKPQGDAGSTFTLPLNWSAAQPIINIFRVLFGGVIWIGVLLASWKVGMKVAG